MSTCFEELGDLDAVADVDSGALGPADVVSGCHRGLALCVHRVPHGTEERAGGTRDDRPCLVGVEQLNGGQTGLMGLVDQPLQDRQLVFRRADIEVAADDQFEIAFFGGLGPQLESFPGERKLGAVPALYPQRALRPTRTLSRRSVLLLQQHDRCATRRERRGACGADDATSDDDNVGATGQCHGGSAGPWRDRRSQQR